MCIGVTIYQSYILFVNYYKKDTIFKINEVNLIQTKNETLIPNIIFCGIPAVTSNGSERIVKKTSIFGENVESLEDHETILKANIYHFHVS